MTDNSSLSLSVTQRAEAIRKAIKEVRRIYATRQVNDALKIRNGPNTLIIIDLPLQSKVRVWREKGGWLGLYTLIAIKG